MMLREKRDLRPVLLKFGVAVALSLGGIIYTFLRTRRIKPPKSPPPSQPPSDCGSQGDLSVDRNDNHGLQRTGSFCNSTFVIPEKIESSYLPKSSTDNCSSDFSPTARLNGDKDSYLLPEFDELVKDFSIAATKSGFSPRKDTETLVSDGETPREYCVKRSGNEQEIQSLRNMVKILKDREKILEVQLLEYYGLKEQETAVMELQNRLKINNMEAKLFSLKIESLQADRKRLQEQVADQARVAAELEAAKAKIKLLKKKLRSEAEINREQILALQERVMKLQEQEKKEVEADPDVQEKLQKLQVLEEEVEELRKSNSTLRLENSELAQKLEYVQLLATSVLENEESTALKEESQRLSKENGKLTKEIEQLQADRCTDVEELVYLRWVNACLRYELRNYQPGPGKTIARDLSKTLSPKSEEKAKHLILDYATKEGQGEKGINLTDFDSEWSSSQNSYLTDSGELDDSSVDMSLANKTHASSKTNFFGKLMRLLRGKEHHHSRSPSAENSACVEDMVGRYSGYSPGGTSGVSTGVDAGGDGINNRSRSSSQGSRYSLDLRRTSDEGSLSILKSIDSIAGGATGSNQENQLDQHPENVHKSELIKYAEVLKDSRKRSFRRRSASFSSF